MTMDPTTGSAVGTSNTFNRESTSGLINQAKLGGSTMSRKWNLGRRGATSLAQLALLALSLSIPGGAAYALNVGYGDLGSSADVYDWPAHLLNDIQSTHNVTSILLDSSTSSYSSSWYWHHAVLAGGSPHGITSISGNGTQQLLIDFSADPLEPGQFVWFEDIFPDDGIPLTLVPSSAVLGATATFTFGDASTWTGVFTSAPPEPGNPLPGGLYTLHELRAVPAPASLPLAVMGMVLMAWMKRKTVSTAGVMRSR